jgi:hypothetical protein
MPKGVLGLGVLALAAAALLWLRKPAPEPLALNVAPVTPIAANAATATPIAQAANPANAARANEVAPAAVDPNSLSAEGATAKPAEVAHATKPSAAAPGSAAPGTSAIASEPSPEKIVLEDDQPSAPATAAAEKPAEKALPPDPALRPADSTTTGAIPVKPSTGAVQAALGAVMSGARHCVAGDEAPSSAVVVFGSDGHVQSVSVSGPAAGKPSGACIQSQLSHARVQPFAQSSFSINATVRPD